MPDNTQDNTLDNTLDNTPDNMPDNIAGQRDWKMERLESVMRKTSGWIALGCSLLALAVVAWAQGRKTGLWEVTSTMTLQQSPFPAGMTPPPDSPLSATPHTTQVCLTQAMIDKFGGPLPQNGDCQLVNIKKDENGVTAEVTCTGRMMGKGTFTSSWSDPEHAKGTTHFTGTVQGRMGTKPIEWTRESVSVFKSADCGDVKPLE